MKKILCITVAIFLIATSLFAEQLRTTMGTPPSVQPEAVNTLLNAATAVGDGTGVDLGGTVNRFACTVVLGGTIPTNVVTKLKGSIDGVTYYDITSNTTTTAELILDGDFSLGAPWLFGAGWTIDASAAYRYATSTLGTLSLPLASMTATPTFNGENYLLNYTISSWTAGNPAITFMGATGIGVAVTGDGTYSRSIAAAATTGNLIFTPSGASDDYKIDNIKMIRNEDGFFSSVKPARYIKGSFVSKSGGGTDTSVTMKCVAGGI